MWVELIPIRHSVGDSFPGGSFCDPHPAVKGKRVKFDKKGVINAKTPGGKGAKGQGMAREIGAFSLRNGPCSCVKPPDSYRKLRVSLRIMAISYSETPVSYGKTRGWYSPQAIWYGIFPFHDTKFRAKHAKTGEID